MEHKIEYTCTKKIGFIRMHTKEYYECVIHALVVLQIYTRPYEGAIYEENRHQRASQICDSLPNELEMLNIVVRNPVDSSSSNLLKSFEQQPKVLPRKFIVYLDLHSNMLQGSLPILLSTRYFHFCLKQ